MNRYVNYHCHSQYSNLVTPDVAITNKDRVSRSVELGHVVASGIEHGITGNIFEFYDLCKGVGIKPLFGVEAYFVKDRIVDDDRPTSEKDRTNAHIVILAKNENGRKAINRMLSEANVSGYYFKPRIDLELLETLPKDDVWVTTACLGGIWKYDDAEKLVVWLHEKFKNNFFLEVQNHNTEKQKSLNAEVLRLSEKYSIPTIAGMDSHYIDTKDAEKRDILLASRNIFYEDEVGWYLDFPDYETAFNRFIEQGILTQEQTRVAMDNTLIFESVEEYTSLIFDKTKIKLPSIYPQKSQAERDEIFRLLVQELWEDEKNKINKNEWEKYEEQISHEMKTVLDTGMADYFLLNYEIIKEGVSKGGQITLTGRGSAASFYISKLLGFTTIDRIKSPVKLYPERFMSKERILETHSLPDIDFNCGTVEPFEVAQEKVMGKGHAYRMITFQRSATSRAWKDYARYSGIDFDTANMVSAQIRQYEDALKYAETDEEKEQVDIYDYLDRKYRETYNASRDFTGIIQSLGSHPCAFLLMDFGKIEEEIGLMRTKGGEICAAIDGKTAEKRLFLKNDLLKVTVVEAIYETFKRIGISPIPADELIEISDHDDKVWKMYENGLTMGLNQVETESTTKKVSSYSPQNISELSSFVAAIRPGFKSNYEQYSKREPFSYGVPAVDRLIQTEQFPYSYMLYQENSMSVLGYAGIPLSKTNQVIKDIAKKRYEEVYKVEEVFKPLMTEKLVSNEGIKKKDAEKISGKTWKIIEDSAFYQFNASHSVCVATDSLYGAWQKANHPLEFYETFLRIWERDGKKDKINRAKIEAETYFGISFPSFKWGQDNTQVLMNKNTNSISLSMKTIKGFGDKFAVTMNELYNEFDGDTFLDLLILAEETGRLSKSKWEKMVSIDYFSEFGGGIYIKKLFDEFVSGKNRYSSKHTDKTKQKRIDGLVEFETTLEKTKTFSVIETIQNEMTILGQVVTKFKQLIPTIGVVQEVDTQYSPKIYIYSLANGTKPLLKMNKREYKKRPMGVGDVVFIESFDKKNKSVPDGEGGFTKLDEKEFWISRWHKLNDFDLSRLFGLNSVKNDTHKVLNIIGAR